MWCFSASLIPIFHHILNLTCAQVIVASLSKPQNTDTCALISPEFPQHQTLCIVKFIAGFRVQGEASRQCIPSRGQCKLSVVPLCPCKAFATPAMEFLEGQLFSPGFSSPPRIPTHSPYYQFLCTSPHFHPPTPPTHTHTLLPLTNCRNSNSTDFILQKGFGHLDLTARSPNISTTQ